MDYVLKIENNGTALTAAGSIPSLAANATGFVFGSFGVAVNANGVVTSAEVAGHSLTVGADVESLEVGKISRGGVFSRNL